MIDPLITQHFRLSEFLVSQTATRRGIENTPSPEALANLRNVLIPGMQAVRVILGKPVHITSGYRSPSLNAIIGGSPNSQHVSGHAADFRCPEYGPPSEVAHRLVSSMQRLKFDQLILEGSGPGAWVHISFAARPRNQVLTATFVDGKPRYTGGIV